MTYIIVPQDERDAPEIACADMDAVRAELADFAEVDRPAKVFTEAWVAEYTCSDGHGDTPEFCASNTSGEFETQDEAVDWAAERSAAQVPDGGFTDHDGNRWIAGGDAEGSDGWSIVRRLNPVRI